MFLRKMLRLFTQWLFVVEQNKFATLRLFAQWLFVVEQNKPATLVIIFDHILSFGIVLVCF